MRGGHVVAGLGAGVGFSAVYYIILICVSEWSLHLPGSVFLGLIAGAIIIKLGLGIVLLTRPRYKGWGLGLLCSIPLALLLLFGLCLGIGFWAGMQN
jgi:hypothetical protein